VALVNPDEFEAGDVDCIYIAASRAEARRVEEALSAKDIDYVVDVAPFEARLLGIFTVEREGLGFYVVVAQGDRSREVLREAGLAQGLID
jgi:hypothetical protein